MPSIAVTPLAFESLGVRSMCTLVRTKDITVLLDAGVALGPRFKLMPHPQEYKARDDARKRIENAALEADIVTVSHYHNDHHTPGYSDPVWLGTSESSIEKIYKGKVLLVKDARRKINTAQRRRGWMFRQNASKMATKFESADAQTFEFGRTRLYFPEPVSHGEDESGLGWVLLCVVERSREKVVFAPDVQGPVVLQTVKMILDQKPNMLIAGGPPTYLRGYKVDDEFFAKALKNMESLASSIETVVIDHHLLRDEKWSEFLEPVRKIAEESGHRILSAAELAGQSPEPLEYQRRLLYEKDAPSKEFLKWAGLPREKQGLTPPPL